MPSPGSIHPVEEIHLQTVAGILITESTKFVGAERGRQTLGKLREVASDRALKEGWWLPSRVGRELFSEEGRELSRCEHEISGRCAVRMVGAECVKVVDHTDSDFVWNWNFYSMGNRKH